MERGQLYLQLVKISYKGIPMWRKCCKFQSTKIPEGGALIHPVAKAAQATRCPTPASFQLSCPECKRPKEVKNFSLHRSGKWITLRCTCCWKAQTCRDWLCKCGIPWAGCAFHVTTGFVCSSVPRMSHSKPPKILEQEFRNISNFLPLPRVDGPSILPGPPIPRLNRRTQLDAHPSGGLKNRGTKRKSELATSSRPSKRCKTINILKRSRAQADFFAEQDSLRAVMRMRECRTAPAYIDLQPHATTHDTVIIHDGFPADHG